MILHSAALSDIGRVRLANQDRALCEDGLHLYGVADGIGGLPCGAEAAQCAVETVRRRVKHADGHPALGAITHAANNAVLTLGSMLSPRTGIGTTLTWGHFRDGHLHLAHVGDSRCYALRDGKLSCLTRDHSLENLAALGDESGRQLRADGHNKDALTRCIGQPMALEIDLFIHALVAGDRYLFCSDGIARVLSEAELSQLLGRNLPSHDIVRELVDVASRHGGGDNATAVVIIVDDAG